MLFDVSAGTLYEQNMWLTGSRFAWTATPTWAKASLLCCLWTREESNLLPAWFSGWAGGIAIDTSGTHRINKRAIGSSISVKNSLPVLFFVHHSVSLYVIKVPQLLQL